MRISNRFGSRIRALALVTMAAGCYRAPHLAPLEPGHPASPRADESTVPRPAEMLGDSKDGPHR